MKEDDPDDKTCQGKRGMTRRGFLSTLGLGAAAATLSGQLLSPTPTSAATQVMAAQETTKLTLHINGRTHRLLVEPRWSLLYVLRERLGLTGAKVGCERGECGACTVLVDDVPRYACLTLAAEAEAAEVTTLEGLMDGEKLGPVQQAFLEEDAFQCGYCTPGEIMAVEGLLRVNSHPSPEEIRKGVSGNLCRCGAYNHIFQAALRAAELRRRL
ncbi:MAG TPA: (2Fe-2S)-binding protein [Syntrophobacteria bacterium]|nr:(2Fe-2S)-binding protein [Syntrophobacteria bacterium]